MGSNPKLKVEGSDLPPHKIEHARRRRAQTEWFKNKTTGFVRCMTDVTIDDGRIAYKTRRNFYELKSFGQTMHWSLKKTEIIAAKDAMSHTFIEERADPLGRMQRVEVKPRHLSIWEYNPRTSVKRKIG